MQSEQIERSLIKKMLSRRAIGSSHFQLETLMKCGWKQHEKKLVKQAIKKLVRKGLIVYAKKSKKALTLNKERLREIKEVYAVEG